MISIQVKLFIFPYKNNGVDFEMATIPGIVLYPLLKHEIQQLIKNNIPVYY